MTAWAAGKFSGDEVGMFVKKIGIGDKIDHQSIIIPGYAAAIAGDVEEELPGWNVPDRPARGRAPGQVPQGMVSG